MTDETILEVTRFLSDPRKRPYAALLDRVAASCNAARNRLGPNVVSRVYGRGDKQGGDLFKSPSKIASKLARKRCGGVPCMPREITDIVGLTVVVQYPDQVRKLIAEVTADLDPHGIRAGKIGKVEKPGYFATHADLVSSNAVHGGLACQLQVKTMLHDAWSAKMRDLTLLPSSRTPGVQFCRAYRPLACAGRAAAGSPR